MKKLIFKKLLCMVLALAMMIGTMSFSDARDVKASTHVGTITAVGAGSGSFLNGANWDPANTSNDMTEIETDVWEITYMGVAAGTYEFKFAADHAWTVSFGTGAAMDSGTSYTAYKDGNNSTLIVAAKSNVTLRLDLRNYDGNNGAKMAALVVPVEEYELTGGGEEPAKETVTYNVTNMSFSGVSYKYQCCRYITTLVPMPGYELPDSIDISIAGTGSLTMGTGYTYDSITGAVTILGGVNNGAVTITAAAVEVYTVAGDAGLCGVDWDPTANSMTSNGDGTYSITFTNVPAGAYGFKVTDGTFDNTWGDNGGNYNITVITTCDVTINFNSSTKEITVSGSGIGSYVYSNMSIAGTGLFASDWTLETMTETSTGIWEYTVDDVAADTYSYKFATDNSWTYSWGADGWYNSSENYSLTVPYDGSRVTFRVDLTGVDMSVPSSVHLTTSVTVTPGSYAVTFPTDANITTTGDTTVTAGTEYTATLSAASGYILPDTITVTIGGVACNDFTYNSTTGVVTIPAACVTGAIVISATAEEELPDTYPVTFPTDANISTVGNTTATEGVGYSATLSAASGYILPDTITVTIGGVACNDFTYNSTTGVVTIPAACVTGAIVISATAEEELPDTYPVTFPTDANISTVGNTTATEGVGYSATLSAASGYILPDTITVTIGGVACNDFTYNSTTGVVTIPAACVSGAIVISATAEEELPDTYPVTFPTDANISTTGNTTATEGVGYSATLSAASGYHLPATITVTIGGVACNDFTYNSTTGVVTIPAACVSGAIVISATAEEDLPDTYAVTFPTDANISTVGNTTATEGVEYTATLSAASGYVLPATITVTIGGVECTDFGYNSENGVINIPKEYVTGDIVITVSAVPIETEDDKLFINGTLTGGEFVEMTESDVNPGEFYYLITGKKGDKVKFKFTFTDAWEDEISASGGADFELELTDDGTTRIYVNTNKLGTGSQNGNYVRYECEMNYGEAGTTAVSANVAVNAGDTTPYVAVAIIAALALGIFILLASKKRIVTE